MACVSWQELYGKSVVRILSRPGKMGLGTAYMDGLRMITGTHVILMDADMSHHPKCVNSTCSLRPVCFGPVLRMLR